MRKCNYCGRVYNDSVETCLSCGSNSFQIEVTNEVVVIETPPPEGYHISPETLRFANQKNTFGYAFGIMTMIIGFFVVGLVGFSLVANGDQEIFDYIFLLLFLMVAIAIGVAAMVVNSISNKKKEVKFAKLKNLSKTGRLVKNLPYVVVDTEYDGMRAIQVRYVSPEGWAMTLRSEPKKDNRLADVDGKADLLIDPRDYTNYYIDVNIR